MPNPTRAQQQSWLDGIERHLQGLRPLGMPDDSATYSLAVLTELLAEQRQTNELLQRLLDAMPRKPGRPRKPEPEVKPAVNVMASSPAIAAALNRDIRRGNGALS